jgi:NADH-quinone oxidoreductase subunit A
MESQVQQAAPALWPLVVYFGAALFITVFMLVLSHLLGQRHMEPATGQPYESGVKPSGSAWIRFDVKYYLVAMFFVIFDVEAIFVFAWAIALYDLGWTGYVEILVFIGILLAALLYLWRMGALDWAAAGREVQNFNGELQKRGDTRRYRQKHG